MISPNTIMSNNHSGFRHLSDPDADILVKEVEGELEKWEEHKKQILADMEQRKRAASEQLQAIHEALAAITNGGEHYSSTFLKKALPEEVFSEEAQENYEKVVYLKQVLSAGLCAGGNCDFSASQDSYDLEKMSRFYPEEMFDLHFVLIVSYRGLLSSSLQGRASPDVASEEASNFETAEGHAGKAGGEGAGGGRGKDTTEAKYDFVTGLIGEVLQRVDDCAKIYWRKQSKLEQTREIQN